MTLNLFLSRLTALAPLSSEDQKALAGINPKKRSVPKHTSLNDRLGLERKSYIVLEGIAARHVRLAPHDRQILAFLLPGDIWNFQESESGGANHIIQTVTDSVVAELTHNDVMSLYAAPGLAQVLRRIVTADLCIAYAWLTNLGRRSAERRLAHLFCELSTRLKAVGRATDIGFDLPLTQTDLADALGLSLVHTNKSLQKLRKMRFFDWEGGRMSIHDFDGLVRFAEFDATYLSQI